MSHGYCTDIVCMNYLNCNKALASDAMQTIIVSSVFNSDYDKKE